MEIRHPADPMSWIMRSDRRQYRWQTPDQAWGLGFCTYTAPDNFPGKRAYRWGRLPAVSQTAHDLQLQFKGNRELSLEITRRADTHGALVETYRLTNRTARALHIERLSVFTPFNDNYPDARRCLTARCHAHIWTGLSASYVNALRMGGTPPHLGLVLGEGQLQDYSIRNRHASHQRGTILLNTPTFVLPAHAGYTLAWSLFWHQGWDDFFAQAVDRYGLVRVATPQYTQVVGRSFPVTFTAAHAIVNPCCLVNGRAVPCRVSDNTVQVEHQPASAGEQVFQLHYGADRETLLRGNAVLPVDALIQARIAFILRHQVKRGWRHGEHCGLRVYDGQTQRICTERFRPDTNPGRERVGMGILIAMAARIYEQPEYREAALAYYPFVRQRLQYRRSNRVKSGLFSWFYNRGYNYPWVLRFYLELYRLTGADRYLEAFHATAQRFFALFPRGFYTIGMPIVETAALPSLPDRIRQAFLDHCRSMGDIIIANGLNYPPHEVNYEQSIVAPAVIYLLELFLVTREARYREAAELQFPALEAFNGQQPDYHLHDIAIRHWDGYWFGKKRQWGDTFPHYWSTLTALAFWRYWQATGRPDYLVRARAILANNLCAFHADGLASCAYLYPRDIDGHPGQFFDPYANDQDWALVHYLMLRPDLEALAP